MIAIEYDRLDHIKYSSFCTCDEYKKVANLYERFETQSTIGTIFLIVSTDYIIKKTRKLHIKFLDNPFT